MHINFNTVDMGSILYLHAYMYIECCLYSKICLKRPLKKENQLSLNAVQTYHSHSAILLPFMKLQIVIKIFESSVLVAAYDRL